MLVAALTMYISNMINLYFTFYHNKVYYFFYDNLFFIELKVYTGMSEIFVTMLLIVEHRVNHQSNI